MGTFHSFISEPLNENEANELLADIQRVAGNSMYENEGNNFTILRTRGFYVVAGVYKNLGSIPIELMQLKTEFKWATVSDEGDYYNSKE